MEVLKVNIGNVIIDNLTMDEALRSIETFIANRKPCYITNPNVDIVMRYNKDKEFARYYDEGALCLADGTPILWAAQFLGTPLKAKISGSDFVPRVCELANAKRYKIFFMGGRPGAGEAAQKKLLESLPNIQIVGTYAPPFGFEKDEKELAHIATMIKQAKPDILFVGLGAPKQERWIKQYHQELGVPVSMGVGVTFEFIAGIVKRSPKWMQHAGLEWLWRLCMEPRRLWKRYLIDDMPFFWLIVKQKLKLF